MRTAKRYLFIVGIILASACSRESTQTSDERSDPRHPSSVFLVTIDTLRADKLSLYGNTTVRTPHLDALGRRGSTFLNAFAQSSTTTPSHASLFSGVYPRDHKAYSNFESIDQELPSLAMDFALSGYETLALVNMRHLNPNISGIATHFETVIESQGHRNAAVSVDVLLDWLDSRDSGRPVFVWLHLVDVHTPYSPPPPFDRLYYHDDEHSDAHDSLEHIWPTLPDYLSNHPLFNAWLDDIRDVNWVIAQYEGAVSYVDYQIGRLVHEVEQRFGPERRPGWVVTSDHGENLGEHGMHFVHTGLYDTTIRVPLIIALPGYEEHASMIHELTELVDIRPTLLEYLGVDQIGPTRGRSLLPLLKGQLAVTKDYILSEHAGRSLAALRTREWKYVAHQRTSQVEKSYPFEAGHEELYDLRRDPQERINVAEHHREIIFAFREKLNSINGLSEFSAGARPEIIAKDLEELRALGYVE